MRTLKRKPLAALTLALLTQLPNFSAAAIPGHSLKELSRPDLKATIAALDLDFAERMKTISQQGPQGYKNLREIMFSQNSRIDDRWKATMAAGRLAGPLSLPELERARRADVWELRSAALIAVSRFDRGAASSWAKEMLMDPALLVRLSAVNTIDKTNDRSALTNLWGALDHKENYRNGKSMFIRRRVVETLSRLESRGAETKFLALLEDSDPKIHGPALNAVERLAGRKFGLHSDPISKRKAACLAWSRSLKR